MRNRHLLKQFMFNLLLISFLIPLNFVHSHGLIEEPPPGSTFVEKLPDLSIRNQKSYLMRNADPF